MMYKLFFTKTQVYKKIYNFGSLIWDDEGRVRIISQFKNSVFPLFNMIDNTE